MGPIFIPGGPGTAPEQPDPAEYVLSYEDLEALVAEQVRRLRGLVRPTEAQAAMDRAAIAAYAEGEVHLASALLMLSAHRAAGVPHAANRVLFQSSIDLGLTVRLRRPPARGDSPGEGR